MLSAEEYRRYALVKLFKYVNPLDAVKNICSILKPSTEIVDVRYSQGKVLAEDIRAPRGRPERNLSHVDGFALHSTDTVNASSTNPAKLRIVNMDPREAGKYKLRRGEAVFVETGHPIPEDADAVAPIESVSVKDGYILVFRPFRSGENVIKAFSDVRRGEVLARKGSIINPIIQKILIDLGVRRVKVYRDPRAAIVSVGTEIIDDVLREPYIPASSAYMVMGMIKYYGAIPVKHMIVNDDPAEISDCVLDLTNDADIIITIGGISLGPRDHTWISLVKRLSPRVVIRGLKIHPGRSTSALGLGNNKVIICLPGLPQSTIAGLTFLILPVITYLRGLDPTLRIPFMEAPAAEDVIIDKFVSFYRLRYVRLRNGFAEVIKDLESYNVSYSLRYDGFTILEPGVIRINKGSSVRVYFLEPLFKHPTMYGVLK